MADAGHPRTRMRPRAVPVALLAALLACLLGAGTALAAAEPVTGGADGSPGVEPAPPVSNTPFDRQGMWVWYLSASEGGDLDALIARARQAKIGTVYVKAADGPDVWSQFHRSTIRRLKRAGLAVCAWQYVYGDRPAAEARAAAIAIRRGADCFAIDAEAEYEGKYAAADLYVRKLRAAVGAAYPISLAGFPYVDYHPSYPYSVFLGPGAATYSQPQMYWKTIGVSVREIFEHTHEYNRIYERPIYPLGQTYEAPGNGQLRLFRRFAASYDGLAPSWWSWQETSGREWGALAAAAARRPVAGYRSQLEHPLLEPGDRGDMVVWAQQHLNAAGAELPVTGVFGKLTRTAVREFKLERGLPANARLDTETWDALLELTPERVRWWVAPGTARASGAAAGPSRPLSASLPARAYEIPFGIGAGAG